MHGQILFRQIIGIGIYVDLVFGLENLVLLNKGRTTWQVTTPTVAILKQNERTDQIALSLRDPQKVAFVNLSSFIVTHLVGSAIGSSFFGRQPAAQGYDVTIETIILIPHYQFDSNPIIWHLFFHDRWRNNLLPREDQIVLLLGDAYIFTSTRVRILPPQRLHRLRVTTIPLSTHLIFSFTGTSIGSIILT